MTLRVDADIIEGSRNKYCFSFFYGHCLVFRLAIKTCLLTQDMGRET